MHIAALARVFGVKVRCAEFKLGAYFEHLIIPDAIIPDPPGSVE
jgi:hypothetical protein